MSVDYAAGLSPYANKGICGLPEYLDEEDALNEKIEKLYQLLSQSHYTVVHTGAGISTSAGIPDFRGPKGVWTLEEQGKNPSPSVAFEKAVPSFTHRALVKLERQGVIHYLITQNIDGLHLRSGFPRDRMSILHGDAFIEQCNRCGTNYIRSTPSKTMGLRPTGVSCTLIKSSSRACRGKICDTILDWESDLPSEDYNRAIEHSKRAELHLCIGTSLQMLPAASLPLLSLQTKASCRRNSRAQRNSQCPLNHSKLVIINLQRTKLYRRAWINIHASADTVFKSLMDKFGFQLPESTPQSPDAVFTPLVILRSCNSDPKEENPWHILPHPTEGAGIRIVDCSLPVSANPVILQCKKEDDDPISTGVIRKQSSSLAMEEKYTNSDEEDVKRLKTEDMKSSIKSLKRIFAGPVSTEWFLYFILLLFRFLLAFNLQPGYLHPDEFFQSVEVAAGDVYDLDTFRAWEFSPSNGGPVRSIAGIGPLVHFPIWVFKHALDWIAGCGKSNSTITYSGTYLLYRILFPVRLATTLGSCIVDLFILYTDAHFRTPQRPKHESFFSRSPPIALTLYASAAFGGLLWSGRSSANTWEMETVALFCLLGIFITDHMRAQSCLVKVFAMMCLQAVLSSWAFFVRPTYVLFIFPMAVAEILLLFRRFHGAILLPGAVCALIASLVLHLCLVIDTAYFTNNNFLQLLLKRSLNSDLICAPCRFFTYNSDHNQLAEHGTHSRFLHLLVNFPLIFGPFVCAFTLFPPSPFRSGRTLFWFSTILPLAILSIIPHQEPRFLIPLVPFALIVSGFRLESHFTNASSRHRFMTFWFIQQFLLFLVFGSLHQGGLVRFFHSLPSWNSSSHAVCPVYVFFHTYMPPRFPFGNPRSSTPLVNSSYPCNSVIDLHGSSLKVLQETLDNLRSERVWKNKTVNVIYPGSVLIPSDTLSNVGELTGRKLFFGHLSTEDWPDLWPKISTRGLLQTVWDSLGHWSTQLSLHVDSFQLR